MLRTTELMVDDFRFTWGSRTYLMGILNITPDSFSGDGLLVGNDDGQALERGEVILDQVLDQARVFVSAGVDILDVGGESRRPGSSPIDVETE